MFIKPAIDAARFSENLSAAMAAKGFNLAEAVAGTGLTEAVISDVVRHGRTDHANVDKLAGFLDQKPRDMAPLISLRDPERGDRLPPEGRDVPPTDFWARRLAEGDVYAAEPDPVVPVTTLAPVSAASSQRPQPETSAPSATEAAVSRRKE